MTRTEFVNGLADLRAARATGDKAAIREAFKKLEEQVGSVRALRDVLMESRPPAGADGIVYWVTAECERPTPYSLCVTLHMMAEEPQFGLLKRWFSQPAETSNQHANRVNWNESDPSYYPNKEAIADAQKAGNDHEIEDLKSLDADKLYKLLRSSRGRMVRFMSQKKPPRGKVHQADWHKYLQMRIGEQARFEKAVEEQVTEQVNDEPSDYSH